VRTFIYRKPMPVMMYTNGEDLAAIVLSPLEATYTLDGGESHWRESHRPVHVSDGWNRKKLWQLLPPDKAEKFAALLAPLWEDTYPDYVEILLQDLRDRHERVGC
jgi:hypothetical protein